MEVTQKKNDQVANMKFSSVYPHYVTKVEKKGRSVEELHKVVHWLTGFDNGRLNELIDQKVSFQEFFDKANLNPNAHLITGVICGYRIENISEEFNTYRNVRYLDKLVDELAKGRKMEKILRAS
ncbi:MAG: DUF2200 domain-containing protein [Nonlabens sp.]